MDSSPKQKSAPFIVYDYDREAVVMRSGSRRHVDCLSILPLVADKSTHELYMKFPKEVHKSLIGIPDMPFLHPVLDLEDYPAGRITFLQERGAKARVIANPMMLYQAMGEPLKLVLEVINTLHLGDTIKVHDQDSGRQQVVDWLMSKQMVYCFDASAFTDRFPYKLQQAALKGLMNHGLIREFDIAVMDMVVSKPWRCSQLGGDVIYKVGQPMGFNPSFALATYTHYCVIRFLERKYGVEKTSVIVGDDVAISHRDVALGYAEIMESLGVTINRQKSLISQNYAEFCGKLLSSQGVIPSTKVLAPRDEAQLESRLVHYGKRCIGYFAREIAEQGFGPLLPEPIGKGIFPVGVSYKKALTYVDTEKWQKYVLGSEIEDFLESLQKVNHARRSEWIRNNLPDFTPLAERDTTLSVNELSGLPVKENRAIRSYNRKDPYSEAVDNANLQVLSAIRNTFDPDRFPDLGKYLNKFGYLDQTKETPYYGGDNLEGRDQTGTHTRSRFYSESITELAKQVSESGQRAVQGTQEGKQKEKKPKGISR